MIEKPPHGNACNRCGKCCEAALCPLASHLLKRDMADAPCPMLERTPAGEAVCGLVSHPEKHLPASLYFKRGHAELVSAALFLIGSGIGCDAVVEGESENSEYLDGLRRSARALKRQAIAAARVFDLEPWLKL